MAKAPKAPMKIFDVDKETNIEFKGEQKTVAELKEVYNFFVDHPDADLKHLMSEIKTAIVDE